jgi:hypothetical protein
MSAVTIAMREERLLSEVLEAIEASTNGRGEISPDCVISVIHDISAGLRLSLDQLPSELQQLRTQAQARRDVKKFSYRASYVNDTVLMCGLWAG